MRHALAAVMTLAGGVLIWGCGNKGGDEHGKPATTATAAATTTAAVATATATAAATAAPVVAKLPEGRSAPPTLEEWNTLKKEVTVKGSSALKCETKIIREYLRVSCKEKIKPEGTPKGIKLLKGGAGAMVFAHNGVMSLILPYVEGTEFEAAFSWTEKSHKLAVKWPKGSKQQPAIVGVFEGAASPLDGTASGDAEKLCACHMKVTKEPNCANLYGAPDPDCDRVYGSDCNKLLACARGEAPVTCLPGFFSFQNRPPCFKQCKAGNDCPKGFVCAPTGFEGLNYCIAD